MTAEQILERLIDIGLTITHHANGEYSISIGYPATDYSIYIDEDTALAILDRLDG